MLPSSSSPPSHSPLPAPLLSVCPHPSRSPLLTHLHPYQVIKFAKQLSAVSGHDWSQIEVQRDHIFNDQVA